MVLKSVMLIGRSNEVKKLNSLYESGQAEFLALYGRRRVGKTYLIDRTFAGKFTFRHAGLSPIDSKTSGRGRMQNQLKHFFHSLCEQGLLDVKKAAEVPASWLDAFYLLEDLLS